MRKWLVGAALLVVAVVVYALAAPPLFYSNDDSAPLSIVDGEVTGANDAATDTVIEVRDPETDEQVGEIRWEGVAYQFTLRNDGTTTIRGIQTRIIPSEAIVQLYDGVDPFNDRKAGARVNYGRLPDIITLEPGETLDVRRSITTYAHETEYATDVTSPLTAEEAKELDKIATKNVVLEVRWAGGTQIFPLESLLESLE